MTQKLKKITASQAAKILDISKTRVLQLINLGIIPAERVGKQFILKERDVKTARGRKAGRPRKHPAPVVPQSSQPITQNTFTPTVPVADNAPNYLENLRQQISNMQNPGRFGLKG